MGSTNIEITFIPCARTGHSVQVPPLGDIHCPLAIGSPLGTADALPAVGDAGRRGTPQDPSQLLVLRGGAEASSSVARIFSLPDHARGESHLIDLEMDRRSKGVSGPDRVSFLRKFVRRVVVNVKITAETTHLL